MNLIFRMSEGLPPIAECQGPLTIASVAFTAFGKIQEGRAAKSAADFNAQVAQRNADISEQQTQARKETQDRERRLRAGANIAAGGASGVGIESFGDVLADNAAQEELDLLTIESEGLLQKQNFEIEASQQKAAGSSALTSSIIGAGTSILGSGAFGGMKTPKLKSGAVDLASKGGIF